MATSEKIYSVETNVIIIDPGGQNKIKDIGNGGGTNNLSNNNKKFDVNKEISPKNKIQIKL